MNNQPVLSVTRKIANFIPSYHPFLKHYGEVFLNGGDGGGGGVLYS